MAHAEGGDTRALGKKGGEQSPCLPRPQPCCSKRPLTRLCGGLQAPVHLPHTHRRGAAGSTVREPSHLSPLSHLVATGPRGEGEGRAKRPCPGFGPCYLMLSFSTRQAGVSSHHPNRPQAARTTKASSSVTTSQVSKASPHQCLPLPSPKPLPSLLPLLRSSPICLPWERPPQSPQ